jgi:ankyrin repeat protein
MFKLVDKWFEFASLNNIEGIKEILNINKTYNGINQINIQNSGGSTALINSCFYGYIDMIKILLEHPNIDVNIQDNYGYNALIVAFYRNKEKTIKILLEHPDIDITLKEYNGNSIFDFMDNNSFLIDYKLQNKILKNGREDIILFFNKYGLVHRGIRKNNPELFQASEWGLF